MKTKFLCAAAIATLGVWGAGASLVRADDAAPLFGTPQSNNQGQNGNGQGQNGNGQGNWFRWPADHAVVDPNHYFEANDPDALVSVAYQNGPNGGAGDTAAAVAAGSLALSAVDQTPSVKHHRLNLGWGGTFDYTARAGHLIASAPNTGSAAANACSQGSANPAAGGPEASMFYMSYTRDDIPAFLRPVTFVWNGGPGEPSIWLHLGSWAPRYLAANAPYFTPGPNAIPDSVPFVKDPDTLLDQTDLVYIDAVGAGLSGAIAPYTNQNLWNTNCDAQLFRDFITAYINKYNRQSSPKYLFGESYGGIRTPIVANLLVQQGTSQYAPDPSHHKPIVLTGFTLQSPILNYATEGENGVPTDAMTAVFYGLTSLGHQSEAAYANSLRAFMASGYEDYFQTFLFVNSNLVPSTQMAQQLSVFTAISPSTLLSQGEASIFGAPFTIAGLINFVADQSYTYEIGPLVYPNAPAANISFDSYDLRVSSSNPAFAVSLPNGNGQLMSNYEDAAFFGIIKNVLHDEFNYQPKDPAQLYGADVVQNWGYNHTQGTGNTTTGLYDTSIPDLIQALTLEPDLRVLVFHGYHDAVCAFYNSEVDLQNGGALPQFSDKISIHDFDGGHMVYLTASSRDPMRSLLRDFYSDTFPASAASAAAPASANAR